MSQVLCKSPNELCGVLRLDDVQQAEWLLDQLAVEMLDGNGAIEAKGKAKEAVGLAVDTVLSTGDADLDTLLRGGLPVGMLTELVGERSVMGAVKCHSRFPNADIFQCSFGGHPLQLLGQDTTCYPNGSVHCNGVVRSLCP